ncbi:MAG: DNA primase [Pseudomonadota bacterium]
MSLPPGFLDELRSRTSLADVVGRKVIWDARKSNQAKGDMWAPCPFHQEKTASFHVEDRKGFYYCFGCHAKGDLFKFVQETENVSFIEAVEILAREAGMTMPERDPQAQEKADRQTELADVTEAAAQFFRLQLKTGAAQAARDYLDRRGLSADMRARFEIGFAPNSRTATLEALGAKGINQARIIEAGIASKPDDGGAPYDAFRDRIVFPIRNQRGRCIGFGGRAMDPNARAKYLNTRETPLFDKGRALFNHGPARAAAGKGEPVIVAEGYMDVIALVQAGFGAAVAPLGTAITEDQLRLLWRMADEPIVALDGDKAGLRAAMRLIDIALPMLEPGKSLRFALMPPGQDPDDLIRTGGADAMTRVLDGAAPLVDLLWRRETEGRVFDSPERRAALDVALNKAVAMIRDPGLRHHYGQTLKDLRWRFFRPKGRAKTSRIPDIAPRAETAGSALAAGEVAETAMRSSLILATLAHHAPLIETFETALERLDTGDFELNRLCQCLLRLSGQGQNDLNAAIDAENLRETLENLMLLGHVRLQAWIRDPNSSDQAQQCLTEEFAKLAARRGIDHELAEGREELSGDEVRPHLAWRINEAVRKRHEAERALGEDGSDDDLVDQRDRERFLRVIEGAGRKEKRH